MFDENFSFAASRSPSLGANSNSSSTRETSRSVSPCSPTAAFPPPRLSVTDLATSFASSRLRPDAQICYDSCEAYANTTDDDAEWTIPADDSDDCSASMSRTRTCPSRPHSPSRRMQRQVHTRMLCSTTHASDIAALVSRMVDCKDQCTIVSPTEAASPTTDEDEGYLSCGDPRTSAHSQSRRPSCTMLKTRLAYRRSSDMKGTGACVSKAVRLRTQRNHKRIRSAENEA